MNLLHRRDPKLIGLAAVPALAGLPSRALTEAGRHIDRIDLPAGAKLADRGRRGSALLLDDPTTEVTADGVVRPAGYTVGLLAGVARSLAPTTVTTTEPTTVWVVAPAALSWLLDVAPRLARAAMDEIAVDAAPATTDTPVPAATG